MAVTPETSGCAIAVVGMACRFPGASTPDEFWENLVHGREARVELSAEALRAAGVREDLLHNPAYVRSAMPLADVAGFDAGFFGFSARDAAIMDPQHRHFLECTWEALEHAGYDPERFDGSIGVFGGSGHNAYFHLNLLGNQMLEEEVGHFLLRHTGNDKDFLATRASYAMNLRGPSVNVQTACSTSLVAVHLAVSSLLSLECDIALAGGVTIEMPLGRGYLHRDGDLLSPDGHCRPFDRSSQGTVFGSGVGLVVLRRLDDALAAGDTIHAVILGSAVNNDGAAKTSYLAPSVDGQAAAIREALVVSDVDPATVSFIECHATGTQLGDAIEVAALREAYGSRVGAGACVLGSVKSNIGHLDTAAGVAGLIKVMLAMRHRTIPGTLHFETPSEHVAAHAPPFIVRRDATRWDHPGRMRAGVNSLGVGGTNAHVLLESPPVPARTTPDRDLQLLPLSARTPAALRQRALDLREALRDTPHSLPDIAWTLQQGRHQFAHRAVVVARGLDEARVALDELLAGPENLGTAALPDASGVSMLFAAAGAAHAGMARELYESEPAYRTAIDRVCAIARDGALLDYDLKRLLTDPAAADERAMEQPTRNLPALFATQYACAQLWASVGVIPTAVIGHREGEYAAACTAGVLSVEDALHLVVRRDQFARVRFRPPQVRMASTSTGGWLTAAQATDPDFWRRQLSEPVRIAEGLALVAREAHVHIEVGPGAMFTSLVGQHPAFDAAHRAISTMRSSREAGHDRVRFYEAYGALWQAGVNVDWTRAHDSGARRRVPLPTYPFEHQRCWFDPVAAPADAPALDLRRAPEQWCQQEVWEPRPFVQGRPAGPLGLLRVGSRDLTSFDDPDLKVEDIALGDDVALRAALGTLGRDRPWTMSSEFDSGDDSPFALERALLLLRQQAETLVDVAPRLSGWRIVVHGAAPRHGHVTAPPLSPVARAVVAAARVLRAELALDVRVIDCARTLLGDARFVAEGLSVGGKDEVVALRGRERLVPQHRPLPLPAFESTFPAFDGCCVITGGVGDLALATASHLADVGWQHIALPATGGGTASRLNRVATLAALADAPLVLFASTGAAVGLASQLDSAAGNAYMDAIADNARAEGRPVLSLGLGVLGDAGIAPAEAGALVLRLVAQVRSGAVSISPLVIDEQRRDGASSASVAAEFVAPRTEREVELARIWEEALGIEPVGVHDDFFHLGGHSLLLTRVATRARMQLGLGAPLARLFVTPTITAWLTAADGGAPRRADDWTTLSRVSRDTFLAPDNATSSSADQRTDIAV